MDKKVFEDLIQPYLQSYNETYQRHFYYNPLTQESVWELPQQILQKLSLFSTLYDQEKLKQSNSINNNNDQKQLNNEDVTNNEKVEDNNIKQDDKNENVEQVNSELNDQILKAVQQQLKIEQKNQFKKQDKVSNSNSRSNSQESQKKNNKKSRNNSRSRSRSYESKSNKNTKKSTQDNQSNQQQQQQQQYQNDQTLAKYLSKDQQDSSSKRYEKDVSKVLSRPARKQLETSLADKHAYKEGDQEYNIWYGRHLSDTRDQVRDHKTPAETRCNSEYDSGFTKADLTDRFNAYFCHHFAKGCCAEGQACRYFHRVPVLAECMAVDNSRDIFGRLRHDKHREDRGGVGSFMFETRSIEVKDFKAPTEGVGLITQMYEILYRHFSEWGDIEDIRYLPNQGRAIIRYIHRCMAEYAKEAMQHQALDRSEVINIKWFLEHKDEENKDKYHNEHFQQLKRVIDQQQIQKDMINNQNIKQEAEMIKKQKKLEKRNQYLAQKKQLQEKQLEQKNLQYLNQILGGDDDEEQEDNNNNENNYENNDNEEINENENEQQEQMNNHVSTLAYPQYGSYPLEYQQQIATYYQQQQLAQSQYIQNINQYYMQNNNNGQNTEEKPLEFKKKNK